MKVKDAAAGVLVNRSTASLPETLAERTLASVDSLTALFVEGST